MDKGGCAALVLAGWLGVAGCASTRPEAHLALATARGRVHAGMTAADLVKTLGRPTEVRARGLSMIGSFHHDELRMRPPRDERNPGAVDRAIDAHLAAHKAAKALPPGDDDALVNLVLRSVGASDRWTWRYHDHVLRAWVCAGLVASLETGPAR